MRWYGDVLSSLSLDMECSLEPLLEELSGDGVILFWLFFSVCHTCSGIFLSGTSVSLFLWMTSLALCTPDDHENVHIIIVQNIITSKHSTEVVRSSSRVVRLLIRRLRSGCLFHVHSVRKILIALPGSSSQHKDAQSIHVYYIPSHTWTMHVRFLNIDYLIAEKWSGQNWTSRTGSAAPAEELI